MIAGFFKLIFQIFLFQKKSQTSNKSNCLKLFPRALQTINHIHKRTSFERHNIYISMTLQRKRKKSKK